MARSRIDFDFRHLLDLCRALRLAEKGNLARGIKPNPEDATRLRTALDFFIAEHDTRAREPLPAYDGLVMR